jgi:NADPH-dependent methylglyoxal reductase
MAAASSHTILVTGATGYVATHVISSLLKAGYNVRGTVRSKGSIPVILAAQGFDAPSRLTFSIVPDITAPHAFDEAVKGVSGIMHTASPFILSVKDNESELLKPAINGTVSILEAAADHAGPQLSRVVITSSFASIVDMSQGYRPGYTYTENDFNPATYREAAESKDGGFSYCASKALAERAAWDWMAEHKPHFTLSTICPPWIFGPYLTPITNLNKLSESVGLIRKLIGTESVPPIDFAGFADVRDVATAHLLAFQSPKAAGQRFLIGNHFDYQTAVDLIREEIPEIKDRVPEGVKGAGLKEDIYQVDGSKAVGVLGLEYTPLNVTLRDLVRQLVATGVQ